jgi:diguanylate cyclase (GGDEF)-like protein
MDRPLPPADVVPDVLPGLLSMLRTARTTGGTRDEQVDRALRGLLEELGMDVALVARLDESGRLVTACVGELLAGEVAPAAPADRLAGLAAAAGADDLQTMTRPMLELLHRMTGMESTYLTVVDWSGNEQHVAFSLDTGDLVIPEGLTVPWGDTLCRRSLEEDRPYAPDVPAVWGDAPAARELGIRSYVSVPIRGPHDDVIGTLCGASSRETPLDDQALMSMRLFARILGDQMRREQVRLADSARAAELEERTRRLSDLAARDGLTGLVNRAGVFAWLRAVIPGIRVEAEQLVVAFVDVDDFKSVNDRHGHAAGDDVLRRLAGSLTTVGRAGDLHGRIGGDEFVVAAVLPASEAALGSWALRLRRAASVATEHGVVSCSVGVTAVGDPALTPEAVLERADEAMYERKSERKASRT